MAEYCNLEGYCLMMEYFDTLSAANHLSALHAKSCFGSTLWFSIPLFVKL